MNPLIPNDLESFLEALLSYRRHASVSFEEYARVGAALLYDKYVILRDASLDIWPASSGRPREPRSKERSDS